MTHREDRCRGAARPATDPAQPRVAGGSRGQLAVGVSLIFKGRYDLGGDSKLEQAIRLNNYVVVGVFLITIINVFIAAFSVTGERPYTQK